MRSKRLSLVLLGFYLVFIGGSAYYNLVFAVREFHHAAMTLLIGLWLLAKWRGEGLPRTALDRPLLAAFGVWSLSAVLSIDPRMSFEGLWFVFLHVFLFYALVDLFQRGRGKAVMEATYILGALVVMITAFEVFAFYALDFQTYDVTWFTPYFGLPRVALALNISTLLAGFTAPLILLTLGWALTARRKDYRQVLWVLSGGLLIVLVLTFSRGGLLSFGLGFAVMVAFQIQRRGWLSPLVMVVGSGLAVLAFAAIFIVTQTRVSGDVVRLDMYESAVEIALDHPLTGVGPAVYGRAFRSYRTPELARDKLASAHNAPLNTLAETGLLGIAVSVWLGVVLVRSAWRTWNAQDTPERKLRSEATIAALLGIAVHSLVDVFTVTPVVLLIVLLIAYTITGHKTVLSERPQGRKWPVLLGAGIAAAYALFFFQTDRAYRLHLQSLDGDSSAAQQARSLDPSLSLYTLEIATIHGRHAYGNPNDTELRQIALDAYESALELEPTWDTGWANLAALEEQAGNLNSAIAHLEHAYAIYPIGAHGIHLARLLEANNDPDTERIIALYLEGIDQPPYLGLSPFWAETPLRREALERYVADETVSPEKRARVAVAQGVPMTVENPQTAEEYAARGILTPESAQADFQQAVDLASLQGDYQVLSGDLRTGKRLTTTYENANLIRARWAENNGNPTPHGEPYILQSIPARTLTQEFAAVLYGGRIADFDVLPSMRNPGPSADWLENWYRYVRHFAATDRESTARNLCRAILQIAPFEGENCNAALRGE